MCVGKFTKFLIKLFPEKAQQTNHYLKLLTKCKIDIFLANYELSNSFDKKYIISSLFAMFKFFYLIIKVKISILSCTEPKLLKLITILKLNTFFCDLSSKNGQTFYKKMKLTF